MSNFVQNVGFRFNTSSKQWLAAFMLATMPVGSAFAEERAKHYELLSLEQIEVREAAARDAGDVQAYHEYDTAADAIRDTIEGKRGSPHDLPIDFDEALHAADNQGNLYKVVNPAGDFDWTQYQIAMKTAAVRAEKVEPGTVVETILADGRVETSKTAGPDGGYRVTNPTGEQYLVDTDKFEKLYVAGDEDGVFVPKPDPRKVLPLEMSVAFEAPWGEAMFIKEGGVLVHGGGKDVYGIQPDEFDQTYTIDAEPT